MLQVITPATNSDLISLEELKAELKITGNTEDPMLTNWIKQISNAVTLACKRTTFGTEIVRQTEFLRSDTRGVVLDRSLNPRTISVNLAGDTLDTDYWILDGTILYKLTSSGFKTYWSGGDKMVIDYTAGYDLPAGAPPALKRICLSAGKALYYASDRDPTLKSEKVLDILDQSFVTGAAASGSSAGISSALETELDPFKDWVIA